MAKALGIPLLYSPLTAVLKSISDSFSIDCSHSYPLDKIERINSHYGYRRRFGRMHWYRLRLNEGDTVRATFDGKVRLWSMTADMGDMW